MFSVRTRAVVAVTALAVAASTVLSGGAASAATVTKVRPGDLVLVPGTVSGATGTAKADFLAEGIHIKTDNNVDAARGYYAIPGGVPLADGTSAKALTGIDDHSRMCACARLMARKRTRAVCDALRAALARYGAPEQILTDNGKVFTGRFNHPPVEVLFDAICREHGIEHLLTQPRSPTTTGKIERFHRTLRAEFLSGQAAFTNLKTAQQALDDVDKRGNDLLREFQSANQ